MLALSRGGGDANVKREFDVRTASFVENGFHLPEAKSGATWIDENTLLVSTDFGPDSMTGSGYARLVKRWRRGQALEAAETMYAGEHSDVWVAASALLDGQRMVALIKRAITFFEQEIFIAPGSNELVQLPIPRQAAVKGLFNGQLLVELSEDWRTNDEQFVQGTLVSFSLEDFLDNSEIDAVYPVFVPTERTSLQQVRTASAAVMVTTLDNVAGKLTAYTFSDGAWRGQPVVLPDLATVNLHYDGVAESSLFASVESFLIPDSLFLVDSKTLRAESIKSFPNRFDAEFVHLAFRDGADSPQVRHGQGMEELVLVAWFNDDDTVGLCDLGCDR